MKRNLILRAAVLAACVPAAAFAATGCGGSGSSSTSSTANANDNEQARAVAEEFKDAWGTDQGDKACSLMTQQAQDHQASLVEAKTCAGRVTQFNRLYDHLKQPSPETLNIVSVTVTGPAAEVVLQAHMEKPERSILLTKSDGKWQVTDFTF